ncbi:hypothetical protein ACQP31_04765 [Actinobacillus pleuropneumoniae]|uniref:Lipoprotein n=2 Tax=Actinobacillus pleuropneumoniae TaxID=715 RepID=B0BPQ1_ACTPJ|nr:hypothetical protein [Actinobacillus pleuropneumoniae]ABY69536.1 hypothetical protein APJL_0978 [Actinobacillus pleuropneumoniae serovar 3 str. JL03]EFL77691.1 hypothetical protein APP2_0741 [Actinobacillus pleuropneumoniae serovar 2 str. 4226]EFL80287.1 hypothetical protein APP6_0406 [Actinobacillus pleuropneumoniae serovar 6 str. Femo]KIE91098.1 hypothetical protein AP518_02868 [Actinobacillus pleuropneumoniae]KIE91402.1 hypothetical protein AP1022_02775 [Actinobacillus pleuropneumoniae]
MKILGVTIFTCLLSGCWTMFTYRENYTIDSMAYWEHVESKVKASSELKNKCFEKFSHTNNYKDLYARCIYENGYLFKTTSWLYCYHKPKECEVYNKYRK